MVWQQLTLGYTYKEIGDNLSVDSSTVQRTVSLFESTGSVHKRLYPEGRLEKKLTPTVKLIIMTLVIQQPGILLRELQTELCHGYGVSIGTSTICQFLHKNGFSRQRMVLIAKQRDEYLRATFVMDVSCYKTDMLVFFDETGADRRNTMRKYGYSLRGKPAKNHKLLIRGKRVSAIAVMSVQGLLDCKIVHESVDGDVFYDFVHVEETVKAIEDVGAIVHFLPPYSPDLNPIEEAFSKIKTTMRSLEEMMIQMDDIEIIALMAFSMITQNDCKNWISDSEIYGHIV